MPLLALLGLCLAPRAVAQNTTSPYSKFGYGLLSDNATAAQRQMGGVGYAMRSSRQVNVMNPASYAAVDSLTFLFDIGADLSLMWRDDGEGFDRDTGGGLDYITMLFPVSRRVGVSVGLVPYSSVGYAFGNSISNGATGHKGSGGLNQLYLGAGYNPVAGLSVGFNVSYLFGKTYNDVYAYTNAGKTSLFEQIIEVRDYHLQFGAQYTVPVGAHRFTAGVSFSPGKSLLGHALVQKYEVNNSNAVSPDTVAYEKLKGNFSLPATWGAGLAYEWDRRLTAEVDFTYQPWSKSDYKAMDNFAASRLCDRYRLGAGASYVPDPRGGYFKRVTYRAGAYWNRDYMMVGDHHVRDIGVGLGLGLPAMGSKTVVNFGLEYVNRRSAAHLLKEQYLNICVGVNFNQAWFFQNKLR